MREHKFRAWHKEWETLDKVISIDWDRNEVQLQDAIGNCDWVSMNDVILMEYTGMKDKDDVEIYEGDIFRRGSYWHEVIFREGEFGTQNDGGSYVGRVVIPLRSIAHKGEVVGNVHKDPTLLESTRSKTK